MEYLMRDGSKEEVIEVIGEVARYGRISHHVRDYRVLEVIHRTKTERMIEPPIPILVVEEM